MIDSYNSDIISLINYIIRLKEGSIGHIVIFFYLGQINRMVQGDGWQLVRKVCLLFFFLRKQVCLLKQAKTTFAHL